MALFSFISPLTFSDFDTLFDRFQRMTTCLIMTVLSPLSCWRMHAQFFIDVDRYRYRIASVSELECLAWQRTLR